jgi:ribosomal RNA-processing protein 8
MAKVPLPDASVDAVVYCLSLMGTDYGSFLKEGARLLRLGGRLWIAEVQSRFVDQSGRSVVGDFEAAVARLGFEKKKVDLGNAYFLVMEYAKRKDDGTRRGSAVEWPELRACAYKKR